KISQAPSNREGGNDLLPLFASLMHALLEDRYAISDMIHMMSRNPRRALGLL
ncbi:hypothetical protein IV102_13660, partial [bacterium]|nr:hypothetical protein [bacterium]